MKATLLSIIFAMSTLTSFNTATAGSDVEKKETVTVCVDVKDKQGQPVKDAKGKVKQNCKEMKVHKKLEGTKVPDKK